MNHVLLLHDDPIFAQTIYALQGGKGLVRHSRHPSPLRTALRELREKPDLVLLDLDSDICREQREQASKLLEEVQQIQPPPAILIVCRPEDEDLYAAARNSGACVLFKPCSPLQVGRSLEILRRKMQATASAALGNTESAACSSPQHQTLLLKIDRYANMPFSVLIMGESGCGKEWVARALHENSARRDKPFIAINCAAIAESLFESILFGHARGAFTGAGAAHPGVFEEAGAGTLFLDEIGDMPLSMQAKLLRVLEEGEFMRVGESLPRRSRARILAATNRDLVLAVHSGHFRQDLYYRLAVLDIQISALRDRKEDKEALWHYFVNRIASQMQVRPCSLTPRALALWLDYPFPGNVRELRNIVVRLLVRYPGRRLCTAHLRSELLPENGIVMTPKVPAVLSPPVPGPEFVPANEAAVVAATANLLPIPGVEGCAEICAQWLRMPDFDLDEALRTFERNLIEAAIRQSGNNISAAARLLGVHRTTLYSRIVSSRVRH